MQFSNPYAILLVLLVIQLSNLIYQIAEIKYNAVKKVYDRQKENSVIKTLLSKMEYNLKLAKFSKDAAMILDKELSLFEYATSAITEAIGAIFNDDEFAITIIDFNADIPIYTKVLVKLVQLIFISPETAYIVSLAKKADQLDIDDQMKMSLIASIENVIFIDMPKVLAENGKTLINLFLSTYQTSTLPILNLVSMYQPHTPATTHQSSTQGIFQLSYLNDLLPYMQRYL